MHLADQQACPALSPDQHSGTTLQAKASVKIIYEKKRKDIFPGMYENTFPFFWEPAVQNCSLRATWIQGQGLVKDDSSDRAEREKYGTL